MSVEDRWLLPEGIEEVLPEQARQVERLRRRLLDLYDSWGYELVIPPFVEFLESLLTGTGRDLELQTFKLTDQLSGRMMGVRADMTPQVARIDAHSLGREAPSRLCYMGTVLFTRGDGLGGTRSPLQIGAELYGHAGFQSDLEVLSLMLETLAAAAVRGVHLELGHVAIVRRLITRANLAPHQQERVLDALSRKAVVELEQHLADTVPDRRLRDALFALVHLHGGDEVLVQAETRLDTADPEIQQALETLHQVGAAVQHRYSDLPIHFDLGELRGYNYHTGIMFAAYTPGQGQAVARGGRYDEIGKVFGRSRPATGFSTDLKTLLALGQAQAPPVRGIYAPQADDPALDILIKELRRQGERVVQALPGAERGPRQLGCDRHLVPDGEAWRVDDLD